MPYSFEVQQIHHQKRQGHAKTRMHHERYLKGIQDLLADQMGPENPAMEQQTALGNELAMDMWTAALSCDDLG